MKKIDQFFESLDKKVDTTFSGFYIFFRKYFVVFSSSILSLLLLMSLFKFYYNKPYFTASLITNDLKSINDALTLIDKKCNILQIRGGKITLDFFNVKKFKGSVVGGMSVAYPVKWQGPYFEINPLLQQKYYELIQAKDGYFIVPGNGVKLPNGFVVGKDFSIDAKTIVIPMLKPGGYLFFKGISLARKILFKIGDWDPTLQIKEDTIEEINSILKEFNAAMPFTKNIQLQDCYRVVGTVSV